MYRMCRKNLYPPLIGMFIGTLRYIGSVTGVSALGWLEHICYNIVMDNINCNWIWIGFTEKLAAFVCYWYAGMICVRYSALCNYVENKFNICNIFITFLKAYLILFESKWVINHNNILRKLSQSHILRYICLDVLISMQLPNCHTGYHHKCNLSHPSK